MHMRTYAFAKQGLTHVRVNDLAQATHSCVLDYAFCTARSHSRSKHIDFVHEEEVLWRNIYISD